MQMAKIKLTKNLRRGLILAGGVAAPFATISGVAYAASSPECKDTTVSGSSTEISVSKLNKCLETNPIVDDIQKVVNFLSAGVGIMVITFLIVGGIQYMAAGDNPTAVGEAKKRIFNALIALVVFIFTTAFLQWLIPGGVFG